MANEQTTENITNDQPSESAEVVDLKHDIPQELEQWALTTLNIDEPSKLTQMQFNAGLRHVHDMYISTLDILQVDNNKPCGTKTYNNIKAINTLTELLYIYIDLCMLYDKHICTWGFCHLAGLEVDTIELWLTDKKASRELKDLSKKLKLLDEESLKDLLVTGRRNPVGIISVLNNRHGWSDKRIIHQTETAPQSLASIADSLGVALPGN